MRELNKSLKTFIRDLASDLPTPGGGSASAVVAAIGVALAEMVIGTVSKRKSVSRALVVKLARAKKSLTVCRRTIETIVDDDVKVYATVGRAYALAKENRRRPQAIEKALEGSFAVMIDLCRSIAYARRNVLTIATVVTGSIVSDLKLANTYLDAAFAGARKTAEINVVYVKTARVQQKMQRIVDSVASNYAKVVKK